ncbi:hypothetical protein [Desulfovibrio sp. JC010]|uniref:hypothetical protein n=1 Tax=Desulfovibrio sp. JC010 TaxID=2593641 RepID=UPI0013D553DA|nr:hypothetical protein [Desulfovibrio sp. JC010]NDV27494.1 hypothetical protein [Desulfovibrio sp. JC010]
MQPRDATLLALERYWSAMSRGPASLPIPDRLEQTLDGSGFPLRYVALPQWAKGLSPTGTIPVPQGCVEPGEGEPWRLTDWIGASFWYLHCQAERRFEDDFGPVHSQSSRLDTIDPVIWERCWVNRMALFLRRWLARELGCDEEKLGPLPDVEITLTCDVDALEKTWAIRGKQTAFRLLSACRSAGKSRARACFSHLGDAFCFAFSTGSYDLFEIMAKAAAPLSLRKICHIHARQDDTSFLQRTLFDPAYGLDDPRTQRLRELCRTYGWEIGLHPSFGSWGDLQKLFREREALEKYAGARVAACRQHWLRFSFAETWKAQEQAGLLEDSTLGFNDLSGFRNGAALRFHPWDESGGRLLRLKAQPLVLMDSQLFSGRYDNAQDRRSRVAELVQEVRDVRGQASFLWHPHTLGSDFNWGDDFLFLIEQLGVEG